MTTTNTDLASTCAHVSDNDNAHAGLLGVALVFVIGPCAEVSGHVTRVERNRWGVSALVSLDDGGEEWVRVEHIRPRGSRGLGCNLA